MYSIRSINGTTRWSQGTYSDKFGYYIKYHTGLYKTGKDVLDTLRAANTVKNVVKALTPQEQALKNAQTSQQHMNMANMLRGTQMPQTALPPIYKQANPFNFGQQNQPVQDTNALANLLRTA